MSNDRTAGLSPWYEALPPAARADTTAALTEALADLLALPVPSPALNGASWTATRDHIVHQVLAAIPLDDAAPAPPVISLIRAFIASKHPSLDDAVAALVTDTAEILFLPRPKRSEYRNATGKTAPYLIHKLMLEYALQSRHLDRLMGALNKGFCVARCPDPPVGCCRLLGYDLGLVPDRMLEAQALEAAYRGWRIPPHPDLRKCRYHTDTGCALRLLKSPACIGAMCAAVEADLDRRFLPGRLRMFRDAMTEFRNSDIDREKVFIAMARLIIAGDRLLGP